MLFYNRSLIWTFHIFFVCKVCVARFVLKTPQHQSGGGGVKGLIMSSFKKTGHFLIEKSEGNISCGYSNH